MYEVERLVCALWDMSGQRSEMARAALFPVAEHSQHTAVVSLSHVCITSYWYAQVDNHCRDVIESSSAVNNTFVYCTHSY